MIALSAEAKESLLAIEKKRNALVGEFESLRGILGPLTLQMIDLKEAGKCEGKEWEDLRAKQKTHQARVREIHAEMADVDLQIGQVMVGDMLEQTTPEELEQALRRVERKQAEQKKTRPSTPKQPKLESDGAEKREACKHRCKDKAAFKHDCCRHGKKMVSTT